MNDELCCIVSWSVLCKRSYQNPEGASTKEKKRKEWKQKNHSNTCNLFHNEVWQYKTWNMSRNATTCVREKHGFSFTNNNKRVLFCSVQSFAMLCSVHHCEIIMHSIECSQNEHFRVPVLFEPSAAVIEFYILFARDSFWILLLLENRPGDWNQAHRQPSRFSKPDCLCWNIYLQ